MSQSTLFTSESVSEGHPDKVADQISDAVLDAILAQDKRARVACETMVKTGVAIVAGEVTTSAWIDLEELVRKVICRHRLQLLRGRLRRQDLRHAQPHRQAVARHQPGRGPQEPGEPGRRRPGPDVRLRHQRDQRTTCRRPSTTPTAWWSSRPRCARANPIRLPWLRPDAKSQVTLRYEDGKVVAIEAVVLSTQHDPSVKQPT